MAAGVVGPARVAVVVVQAVPPVPVVVRARVPVPPVVPQAVRVAVLVAQAHAVRRAVAVVEVAGLHVVHGVSVVVITGARVRGQVNCLVGAVHDIATSTA